MRFLNRIAALSSALLISTGSVALAAGGSDTTGEGLHCYLFFSLPDDKFAQVMLNDDLARISQTKGCIGAEKLG